jgi:hypothetical protein
MWMYFSRGIQRATAAPPHTIMILDNTKSTPLFRLFCELL